MQTMYQYNIDKFVGAVNANYCDHKKWLKAEELLHEQGYWVVCYVVMADGTSHRLKQVHIASDADLLRVCILTGLRCDLIKETTNEATRDTMPETRV